MDQGKTLLNYALTNCSEKCSVEAEYQRCGPVETNVPFIVVTLKITRYFRNFEPIEQMYSFNSQGRLFFMEQVNHDTNEAETTTRSFDSLTLNEAKGLILSIS